MAMFKMCDSVHSARYSSIRNVLRLWSIWLIPNVNDDAYVLFKSIELQIRQVLSHHLKNSLQSTNTSVLDKIKEEKTFSFIGLWCLLMSMIIKMQISYCRK